MNLLHEKMNKVFDLFIICYNKKFLDEGCEICKNWALNIYRNVFSNSQESLQKHLSENEKKIEQLKQDHEEMVEKLTVEHSKKMQEMSNEHKAKIQVSFIYMYYTES